MDYKKKYKEALERAKEIKSKLLLLHLSTESCKAVSEYIDTIIPELSESEDEKIRKWLIKETHRLHDSAIKLMYQEDIDKTEAALAWLEKQKEEEEMITVSKEAWDENAKDSFEKGIKVGMIRQQKEQKPSINIDQLKSLMLQYLQEAASEKDDSDIEADTDKWARKILGYDFEQKPAEWSEEDERMLSRCVKSIESSKQFADSDTFKKAKDKEINWLENRIKSFRPIKQEWSEEDEHRRKDAIYFLESAKKHYADTSEIEKTIDWLKSLRPHWKPSEEQMKALETAIHIFPVDAKNRKELELLKAQLNKL